MVLKIGMSGTTINGRYTLGEHLGSGSFGSVYKGVDILTNNEVAIKTTKINSSLEMDAEYTYYRLFGGNNSNFICHPNIISYYDAFQINGVLYIIMEYVDGYNLRSWFKARSNELSPSLIINIMGQIINGLKFLHDQGIVHNDIKDDNIMIDKRGNVKIADYGLACFLTYTPECIRKKVGNRLYISLPIIKRYINGNRFIDGNSVPYLFDNDVWAIGLVFYQLCNNGVLPEATTLSKKPKRYYNYWIANPVTSDIYFGGSPDQNKLINDIVKRCLYIPPQPLSLRGRPTIQDIYQMYNQGGDAIRNSNISKYENLNIESLIDIGLSSNLKLEPFKKMLLVPTRKLHNNELIQSTSATIINISDSRQPDGILADIPVIFGVNKYGELKQIILTHLISRSDIMISSGPSIKNDEDVVTADDFVGMSSNLTLFVIDYLTWSLNDYLNYAISIGYSIDDFRKFLINEIVKHNDILKYQCSSSFQQASPSNLVLNDGSITLRLVMDITNSEYILTVQPNSTYSDLKKYLSNVFRISNNITLTIFNPGLNVGQIPLDSKIIQVNDLIDNSYLRVHY